MNAWIFQNNPSKANGYDVEKSDPSWWEVSRYGHEIKKGDHIIFWRAGRDAGIHKIGEIIAVPDKKKVDWVGVKVTKHLEKPILRSELVSNRFLKNLSVIRQRQGLNFRVKPSEWAKLQKLINRPSAFCIPAKVSKKVKSSGFFNPTNIKDARERILASVVRRRGQPEFRQRLLEIYQNKCLVTGCSAKQVLEAAHIHPYKGKHTNHSSNGLLLRADLHTLFDLRLISINPTSRRLHIAPELRDTLYVELDGKKLKFPEEPPAALNWHFSEFNRHLSQNG